LTEPASVTDPAEPARVVSAGQVKLSDDQLVVARVKLPMGPATSLAETQAAPAVRVPRTRWIAPAIVAAVVVMLGGVGIAWWSRSHPVTTPRVDAAPVVRPDAAPARPDSSAASRPRAKMTAEEVERMLEWAKRAADGGRYFKPSGDNVIELLGLVELDYPGHEGAAALRQELCRRLEKSAKRAERRRHYALAGRALENWLALDPENAAARARLARLELLQGQQALARGNTKQAMVHAKAAQKLFPDSAAAAELRGDIAYKRKKYAAALKHYEGALEVQDLGAALKRRLEKKVKHLRKWVH
jgi:hypothetical protein